MTTTSSTTSTAPTTSATASIIKTLGSGSGIDTGALVTSLVQAQFAAKTDTLTGKATAVAAQISGVAKLQSGITGFATALSTLVKGGTLTTQPTVSNSAVATAAALPGATLAGLNRSVTVDALATAQSATTVASFASRTATVGTGTITIQRGSATVTNGALGPLTPAGSAVTITIGEGDKTLDGIVRKINAANVGVTASVVTDADGTARVVLKGQTGSNSAFTVSGSSPELAQFDVGDGQAATAVDGQAADARLKVDGVSVTRASNTVSDLIDGVKLTLTGTGTVTLGATSPSDALSQAVADVVETYNQLLATIATETDPINGDLKDDAAAKTLRTSLAHLTLSKLITDGSSPSTLAEIGVATNRDGTLRVDSAALTRAITTYPAAVEAMFNPGSGSTAIGLSGALNAISTAATDTIYGLAHSTTVYTANQSDIADAQSKLSDDESTATTRMTAQFAAMDARVAAYKSTQSFLTAQIDAWNNQGKN